MEIHSRGINHQWAQCFIEELVRLGCTHYFLSPGSRVTPLVCAIAERDDIHISLCNDERNAGFCALGYAIAAKKPAAIVCTSGTAVANYFPAIIEASLSSVPILVLTADRPHEMVDTQANQTIEQTHLYGNYVRWAFEFQAPEAHFDLSALLTATDFAHFRTLAPQPGPVHLNCRFHKPLIQIETIEKNYFHVKPKLRHWLESKIPFTVYSNNISPAATISEDLIEQLDKAKSCLIVVAREDYASPELLALAKHLHAPIIADITSGLRYGQVSKEIICYHDLFLDKAMMEKGLSPELIILLGGSPIDNSTLEFLQQCPCPQIMVNTHYQRIDPWGSISYKITADISDFCQQLHNRLSPKEPEFLQSWQRCELAAQEKLEFYNQEIPYNESAAICQLIEQLNPNSGLYIGNSMVIREANAMAGLLSNPLQIAYNRGASGIDGLIASAVGFAQAIEDNTLLLIGDMSFLHNLNALELVAKSKFPVKIALLNNFGSAIFSCLPGIQNTDYFSEYFALAHNQSFEHAAALYQLPYRLVDNADSLAQVLKKDLNNKQSMLIEVKLDKDKTARDFTMLKQMIVKQLVQNL